MSVLLFGQPGTGARRVWNASDFVDVNDTVRGGSSTSAMHVVVGEEDDNDDVDKGAIDFTGYLDTTTLGGAGFASQAYSRPWPGTPIDGKTYSGLGLVGRRLCAAAAAAAATSNVPGGGKARVTSYVITLKTVEPQRRPDGRRESQISYEWKIDVGHTSSIDVQAAWSEFKPTYRGRPAPDAAPLDPAEVKEWSIMARSDFGDQSGPFAIRLLSLSAAASSSSAKTASVPSYVVAMDGNRSSSGEYYGFALFVFATVVMVAWLVWALTPDRILHRLGVEWYPNREWAFLLPAWSLFAVLFVYVAFIALNTYNNPDLSDLAQVVDSHSNIFPIDDKDGGRPHPLRGLSMAQTGGVHGPLAEDIYDLPPGVISRERHGVRVESVIAE